MLRKIVLRFFQEKFLFCMEQKIIWYKYDKISAGLEKEVEKRTKFDIINLRTGKNSFHDDYERK